MSVATFSTLRKFLADMVHSFDLRAADGGSYCAKSDSERLTGHATAVWATQRKRGRHARRDALLQLADMNALGRLQELGGLRPPRRRYRRLMGVL